MICTCGRIALGMEVTENRNWNPECEEHKVGSVWWKEVGHAQMDAQNARLRELYRLRDEARESK